MPAPSLLRACLCLCEMVLPPPSSACFSEQTSLSPLSYPTSPNSLHSRAKGLQSLAASGTSTSSASPWSKGQAGAGREIGMRSLIPLISGPT